MKSKSILVVVMVMVTTVLVCGTGAKATIVNPSFENSLTGWVTYNDPGMNRYPEDTFATDGQYNLQLFTEGGTSNTKGDKSGVYQNVSLTDIGQILFDVKLSSHYYGEPSIFRDYEALFLIDGTTYWAQTVEGTYLNQFVDVSALSGSHRIELRLECIKDENYSPSCWAEWDNLRAIPGQPPTLVGLEIEGLNEVAEDFQAQYKAIAHYDIGSPKDVTNSADWSVEPNAIASINGNGLLATEEIYILEEDITIYAQYMEDTNTVEAEKAVSVFAICPIGKALSFDGVGDYVDCGTDSNLDFTDAITIGAWVKRPNFDTHGVIAGKTNGDSRTAGYGLFSYIGGLEFNFYSGGTWRRTTPPVSIPANEWHHVVGTFDGNDAYLYVDGEQNASLAYSGTIAAATGHSFHISFWRPGIPVYFNGSIDDVCIYDRALSPEEIQANMHILLSGDEPNLVGYWGFGEGEGQVAYDLSGNSNNGYLGSDPCDVDSADPAWVESDAPIGICTTGGLIERNITRALESKQRALEEIEAALANENATIGVLEALFRSRDYGNLDKNDIVKAKQEIHSAVQNEQRSTDTLEKSIEKLEDSLSVLGYGVEPNVSNN